MAGMIPGVEPARIRRKCRKSSELLPSTTAYAGLSTRRSSLTSTSFMSNPGKKQALLFDESKLGAEAREAKKRLDARLQHPWKSQSTRSPSEQANSAKEEARTISNKLKWLKIKWKSSDQECAVCLEQDAKEETRTISKKLKWLKIKWKSSEEEECAVCLEPFNGEGESIMHLPCAHKFHTKCLVPWLEVKPNCPSCRMKIPQ